MPNSSATSFVAPIAAHAASPGPARIAIFTDTLADINGVSRFIRAAAAYSPHIHVLTSTRLDSPRAANIHNIPPRCSWPMPGYPNLDIVLPRGRELCRAAEQLHPDIVHVSTPGPVGLVGRRFALERGLPLLATYHTDFPAYIDHLFNDAAATHLARRAMRWFYQPFTRILTRSNNYAHALELSGIPSTRIETLQPGIDTDAFHIRHRDPTGAIWQSIPSIRPDSTKVLYVGRISVEKNLSLLTRLWPRIRRAAQARRIDTQLILIGDGPYRDRMQRELAAHDAHFFGFRHAPELSTLYASSDLFVFPSTTDTLGQVVMEAQASGLPVIVTNQGGPHEVVDDHRTGFVLPNTDNLWHETIFQLLTNPALCKHMSAAAHAKIAPMSIARSLDHFVSIHESVLQRA